ncbi:MAG: HAD hydrolase family protein [Candidatus Gracilibacteria bacterium]|nr:HAD hydrolase family protein [Candidatus Gracilibacteria bacterium]
MSNLNNVNQNNSIHEQREKLLVLNSDLLFGVYSLKSYDEFKQEIKLELSQNTLTCYPNQIQNIKGLKENSEISILDLNELRKGKIKLLHGKEVSIINPILLSGGVSEYIESNKGKKHIFTSLRDNGSIDGFQRTVTGGRCTGYNLVNEAKKEHIEECPFLGKNFAGEYVLATISMDSNDLEILINSINFFLENKFNKKADSNYEKVVKMFERNFPGIKYEELGDILRDIVKQKRFMLYKSNIGEIGELNEDKKTIIIENNGNELSKGTFFTFIDKINNTIEYSLIQKFEGFEQGFIPLSKRPSRLFLESQNQYSRTPKIEQASINSKVVPIVKYISDKVHFLVNRNDLKTQYGIITSKEKDLKKLQEKVNLDVEKTNGKSIIFDIDGVLIEAGLEVGTKQDLTVEDYAFKNKETIIKIRETLKKLSLNGYEIILCTGRGDDFATKVGEIILLGNYDKIISEGGVLIKDRDGKTQVCEGLEDKSKYINMIKETLIKYVKSLGGHFEEGKEFVLSFNPPKGVDIMKFKENLINFLSSTFLGYERFLLITNSQTAVDILPLGTDKIIALNKVIGGKYMIYFGDSNNDIPALKESQLGIIPANAGQDFKEKVRKYGNITLTTNSKELTGVLEGLNFISKI